MAGPQQRLNDAKIIVKVDTTQARKDIAGLQRERERQEERKTGKDKKRKDDKKAKEKTGIAVIPGRGILRKVIGAFVLVELGKIILDITAGTLKEFGENVKDIPILRDVVDQMAIKVQTDAKNIRKIQGVIGAVIGTTGDVASFARAQLLITGKTSLEDVAAIAKQQLSIRSVEAQLEAERTTIGRVAGAQAIAKLGIEATKRTLAILRNGAFQITK